MDLGRRNRSDTEERGCQGLRFASARSIHKQRPLFCRGYLSYVVRPGRWIVPSGLAPFQSVGQPVSFLTRLVRAFLGSAWSRSG